MKEAEREQLYASGMSSLAEDLARAERQFGQVITTATAADRLSSLAHVRIAAIRLLGGDLPGCAGALDRSLDGPESHPEEEWVGQLLQTVLQGAEKLRTQRRSDLALPVVRRAAVIARRAGGALAREAELGATVVLGALECERGALQAGLAGLDAVAKTPMVGLTLPQRSFVAQALFGLAQAHEQSGDLSGAERYYQDIVRRFADDTWPQTARTVALARVRL
jgi:hypothetical protein